MKAYNKTGVIDSLDDIPWNKPVVVSERGERMISFKPIIELLYQLIDFMQDEQERLSHEDNVGDKWMDLEKRQTAMRKAIMALSEAMKV
jgi:hypothetical protein